MNRTEARYALALIFGGFGVFLFFFILAIYGGVKYMGAFGDLTSNPPKIEAPKDP
jgi:hypothetical protein